MSTTINYTNSYGEIVSLQQVDNLDYFEKHFFIDGLMKRKEFFKEGILSKVLYFVSNENLNDLIEQFQNIETTFYTNYTNYGIYNQFEALTYKQSNLIAKSIMVLDTLEMIICEKKLNVLTASVIEYDKYFYVDQELVYMFEYYNTGNLRKIISFTENGTEEFFHDTQRVNEFDWTDLLYYQNGEPIIPS
jgi:hypothetical protein